jgi:hypothetical protein
MFRGHIPAVKASQADAILNSIKKVNMGCFASMWLAE